MPSYCKLVLTVCKSLKNAIACICRDVRRCANFRICGIVSAYTILKTQLYVEKYAICGFCNIWDRICGRMFSYNRYLYNCASVQRALLAPEILNESFLKCRYFTALLPRQVVRPSVCPSAVAAPGIFSWGLKLGHVAIGERAERKPTGIREPGAETPAGSRGRAPGGGQGALAP